MGMDGLVGCVPLLRWFLSFPLPCPSTSETLHLRFNSHIPWDFVGKVYDHSRNNKHNLDLNYSAVLVFSLSFIFRKETNRRATGANINFSAQSNQT